MALREKQMEDLIAAFPEDFFPRKKLTLKGRQQSYAGVGRFDLLFVDEFQTNILMELKAVPAKYQDADQLAKYRDELQRRGEGHLLMWLVAPDIPKSVREFLDRIGIEYTEVHESEFRLVAERHAIPLTDSHFIENRENRYAESFVSAMPTLKTVSSSSISSSSRETAWFYWKNADSGEEFLLAFVNAKGSCSMRPFSARTGEAYRRPPNKAGDFRDVYVDLLRSAKELYDRPVVNLERECKQKLPDFILEKLQRQVRSLK